MNMRKTAATASITLAIFSAGAAVMWYAEQLWFRQTASNRSNVATIDQRRLKSNISVLPQKQEPELARQNLTPATAQTTARRVRAPAAGGQADVSSLTVTYEDGTVKQASDIARQVDRQYGAFLAAYAARGKDAAKLRELFEERQRRGNDVLEAAIKEGVDVMNPASRRQLNEISAAADKEVIDLIKQTIGKDEYGKYIEFELKRPERTVADALVASLQNGPNALNDSLYNNVVDVLYRTREPNGTRRIASSVGSNGVPSQDGEPMRVIPAAAIEAMRGILTPEQIQALTAIQISQHSNIAKLHR